MSGRGRGRGGRKAAGGRSAKPKEEVVEVKKTSPKQSPRGSPRRYREGEAGGEAIMVFENGYIYVKLDNLVKVSNSVNDLVEGGFGTEKNLDIATAPPGEPPKRLLHRALLTKIFNNEFAEKDADLRKELEPISYNDRMAILDILDFFDAKKPLEVVATVEAEAIEKFSEEYPDDEAFAKAIGIEIDTTPEEREKYRKEFFNFEQPKKEEEKGKEKEGKTSPKKSPRKESPKKSPRKEEEED